MVRAIQRRLLNLLALAVLLTAGIAHAGDYQKGVDASLRGDYAAALKEWQPLAERGHASPQFQMGWLYQRGLGVQQSDAQAVMWYGRAATQGYAFAQTALGKLYAAGQGVAQNDTVALMWFMVAASSWDKGAKSHRDALSSKMAPAAVKAAEGAARICRQTRFKKCGLQ